MWSHGGDPQGATRAPRHGVQRGRAGLTSSSRRRCSFCSSMRFCRSASSCRLCSSFSLCCCSSCCRRRASERSLLASCSLRKSRRSVDSPGRFRMELWAGQRSGCRTGHVEQGRPYCGSVGEVRAKTSAAVSKRSHMPKHRLSDALLVILLPPLPKKLSQGKRCVSGLPLSVTIAYTCCHHL